jgi:ubiquinol-cytochrome c reductase cytochrome c1 subunit
MTIRSTLLAAAALAGLAGVSVTSVQAAGDAPQPPRQTWSFSGPFGMYDRAQLQRGFKVYREVCSSCHSLSRVSFRNLAQAGGPEFTAAQVQALASEYKVKDGPNDAGEMFERNGRASDRFPLVHANEKAARAANGGAYPPDFSVLAKARSYSRGFPWFLTDALTQYQEHGVDYITALLTGYEKAPAGIVVQPGQYYNKYMPGHLIAMAAPLNTGQIEYPKSADGKAVVPETAEQYAKDVAAFMMWSAEPHLEQRKQVGFKVVAFLMLFAGLLFFTKKKIWARAHEEDNKAA